LTDQIQRSGVSADAQAIMAFESRKKSAGVTYLLWFFLGGLGVHRFYLGRTGSGIAILALNILGWVFLFAAGAGLLLLIPVAIWLLVDLFAIPGMVRSHNNLLLAKLASSESPVLVAARS